MSTTANKTEPRTLEHRIAAAFELAHRHSG